MKKIPPTRTINGEWLNKYCITRTAAKTINPKTVILYASNSRNLRVDDSHPSLTFEGDMFKVAAIFK